MNGFEGPYVNVPKAIERLLHVDEVSALDMALLEHKATHTQ